MGKKWLAFVLLTMIAVVGACAPAPTATPAPTSTPTATNTPVATATPLPTNPPLPTAIPTEAQDDTLSDLRMSARANIRTVHADPGLPEVDVYLNNQIAGFSLGYGDASGQADVVAGDYFLRLISAGGRTDDTPLAEIPLTLERSANIIAVIMPGGDIQFFDENMESLPGTEASVQVINAIPDSPRTALPLEEAPEAAAFPPIGYGERSDTVLYEQGDYALDFTDLLLDYRVNLRGGRVYTFVLIGTPDDPEIIEFDADVPAQGAISFVNLSEQVGTVDVYLNDELLTAEIPFRRGDNLFQLPVNTYDVAIYETGADPETVEPLIERPVSLNPDDELFVLLVGPANDLQLITYQESNNPTEAGETRITFISAVSDVTRLEEIRNEDTQIVVSYARPTTITLPEGERDFEFVTDFTQDDYTIVEFIAEQEFEAGISYLILMTGQGNIGDDPFIYEAPVGTEEEPIIIQDDEPPPPQMSLVNAIDQTVQVIVNGVLITNNLEPGRRTDLLTLEAREHIITVESAEERNEIYTTRQVLQVDSSYNFVLYGDPETENYTIADFPLTEANPNYNLRVGATLRLVNVSLEQSQEIALGYESAGPAEQATQEITEPGTFPLPAGVTGFTNLAVPSREASEPVVIAAGRYNLYAYDSDSREVVAAVYGVQLGLNTYTEIIVTAQPGETPYTAYAVPSALAR